MKRSDKLLALVLAVLLVLPIALASCETPNLESESATETLPPATADELFARADWEMSKVESYEGDATIDAVFYAAGVKFNLTGESKLVLSKEGGSLQYYYTSTSMKARSPWSGQETTSASMEAYHDGKMFVKTATGGKTMLQLYAETTAEKYWEKLSEDVSFDYDACAEKSFEKTEDGGWTLLFSGYSKKALGVLLGKNGLADLAFGAEIMDVSVKITLTEDYLLAGEEVTFVFEEVEKNPPSLKITTGYSAYNEAELPAEELNAEDYMEVPDLYFVKELGEKMKNALETKNGTFSYESQHRVTLYDWADLRGDPSAKWSYLEQIEGSFGEKSGGYFYNTEVSARENGAVTYEGEIYYKNGVQTVDLIVANAGAASEETAQTEEEARAFIASLLTTKFASSSVQIVTGRSDGSYTFVCTLEDYSEYNSFFSNYDFPDTTAETVLTVETKNGEIVKIEETVKIISSKPNLYNRMSTAAVEVHRTVVFDDSVSADDGVI